MTTDQASTTPADTTADPTADTASTESELAADGTVHDIPEDGSPSATADEDGIFERWSSLQVRFVKDPHGAVAEADALIDEVVEARRKAFDAHRGSIADRWRETGADTEELRMILQDYRKVLQVLFPRQTREI